MKIFFRPESIALVLVLALAGCDDEPPAKPEIRPVRTVVVDPMPIDDDRQAVGEIRPRYESDLGFRVAGKLISRTVDVGVEVGKGDLLARLDDQDYKTRVLSAEADVSSAEAVLVEARNAEERSKVLLERAVTTRARYDASLRDLRSAQAKVVSNTAALALAKDQLVYSELHAEFDGIVTAIGAEPGQVIGVGQMIVRLAKPNDIDAVFNIAESAFRDRKKDRHPHILVSLLSNPGVTADGVVREVSPVADPTTRTYQVKVTLSDPPEAMRFGAGVLGRLKTETAAVVVLPGSALFDKKGKPAVWLYDGATSSVKLQPVIVTKFETDRIVVRKGLTKGDIVVTAGVNRLRGGQKVRLITGAGQ